MFNISDVELFRDAWPIEEKIRFRITERQLDIIQEMDLLIRMEILEKSGKKEERVEKGKDKKTKAYTWEDSEEMKDGSKNRPTTMDELNQTRSAFHENLRQIEEVMRKVNEKVDGEGNDESDDGIMNKDTSHRLEDAISDADKFEVTQVSTTKEHMRSRSKAYVDDESIPDRVNLIDLLYNEGCISFRHKQRIEQQPTQKLRNIEMFQLIKNGSIKTLKLANDYFIRTGQRNVFEMMNKKYLSGGKIPIFQNFFNIRC